jgi:hypothetical protein
MYIIYDSYLRDGRIMGEVSIRIKKLCDNLTSMMHLQGQSLVKVAFGQLSDLCTLRYRTQSIFSLTN